MTRRFIALITSGVGALLLSSCQTMADDRAPQTIQTETTDGVTLYGYELGSNAGSDAPLILLFHQGGSNARGEYQDIAAWLQSEGYRTLAWDLRSGGEVYGSANQTKLGMQDGTPSGFCDAYPDMEAALLYVRNKDRDSKVIVWGSSYSGALSFQLAANNPDLIDAVIAASPASGKPLANCLAREWAARVEGPTLVLRPQLEMEWDGPQEQRRIFSEFDIDFMVVADGIHGSSMLLDERTDADMAQTRADVISWLRDHNLP